MGTWIEFRCENRNAKSSKAGAPEGNRCWSHDNFGPMDMAGDTLASVQATFRGMARMARNEGWLKTKYGWVCPFCAAQPTLMEDLKATNA